MDGPNPLKTGARTRGLFFETFRAAVARLPAGLLRPGAPADPRALAAAEQALGTKLPAVYASFLASFDGADLFHEGIVIAGVGAAAARPLLDLNPDRPVAELVFAETLAGDRFLFSKAAAIVRSRAGSDERVLSGTDFPSWLNATIAREQLLYDADGEFAADAFEPDGEEVTPRTALRQAERALRHDPGSAEAHFDRGVALRRLGRTDDAMESFERAGTLDAANPWPWFDLGRTAVEGAPRRAMAAFRRAAEIEPGAAGARFLAWAAHAALAAVDEGAAREARVEALQRAPALADDLRRAVAAATDDGDDEAAAQADLLVAAIDPTPTPEPARRFRLPILAPPRDAEPVAPPVPPPAKGRSADRPPPGRPRRPRRAARPR